MADRSRDVFPLLRTPSRYRVYEANQARTIKHAAKYVVRTVAIVARTVPVPEAYRTARPLQNLHQFHSSPGSQVG
jgi:hypothetical protein